MERLSDTFALVPLVFFSSEGAERSGYRYADRTGVSYEFPDAYLARILPGTPFVYHLAARGYTGAGIVGPIRPSTQVGRSVCEILDYRGFDSDVPLKRPDGYYYEADPDAGKVNVYCAQGVRSISVGQFELIVAASLSQETPLRPGTYASVEDANEIERASVDRAIAWLQSQYPDQSVVEMPRNNPGFDLVVGDVADPKLYVEVKGTRADSSVFWMTEGERAFSAANSAKYMLIVVSSLRPSEAGAGDWNLRARTGAVGGDDFVLEPSQWRGLLR
ncbi:protein NO VEIN domain-containing protein [Leifsonia sp. NPDC102414]|uniref:protein NO VEIN domain-containing protein n=1 Tax=Leifsonia sp. NPDC102414 TaxID=3364124 RepID=UPI003824C6EF